MRILHEKPPEWIMDGCLSRFRVNVERTLWTYGDAIYNPGAWDIPGHLLAHEATHEKQQAAFEGGPDAWWRRFLEDPDFRYQQELEASVVEYLACCDVQKDRNRQATILYGIAGKISGPLYQLPVTRQQAITAIRSIAESL